MPTNPSSLPSGPDASSRKQLATNTSYIKGSLTPSDYLEVGRCNDIFPPRFDIPKTAEEAQLFLNDPIARPPATMRQQIWWNSEGAKTWETRQLAAEREYLQALERHELDVVEVDRKNAAAESDYKRAMSGYKRRLASFASDLASFEQFSSPPRVVPAMNRALARTISDALPIIRQVLKDLRTQSSDVFSSFEKCKHAFVWKDIRPGYGFLTDLNNIVSPIDFVEDFGAVHNGWSGVKLYQFFRNPYRIDAICREMEDDVWWIWQRRIGSKIDREWNDRRRIEELDSNYSHGGYGRSPSLEFSKLRPVKPRKPRGPSLTTYPTAPGRLVAEKPAIPQHCFDSNVVSHLQAVLKGAVLFNIEDNVCAARTRVFAGGQLQPYFAFAGLPLTYPKGQTRHFLYVGQAGSGKTALILQLMSFFLPLAKRQVSNIIARTTPDEICRPSSSHEWSRSLTHQAVVYNAKSEYVPYLAAFGLNVDAEGNSDVIILDPGDSRCFSWDIAADIHSQEDAKDFAEMIVPMSKESAAKKKDGDIWELLARDIIVATIVSLRNASISRHGKQTWNFHDLITAFSTPEVLEGVLQYHDTPEAIIAHLIDLSASQKSSVYMSATAYLSQFATTAQQWLKAERNGRKVSLSDWAMNGSGTVLVLPNTEEHKSSYSPLNQALFAALTRLFLDSDYTKYIDASGIKQVRKRYVFMDEIGDAGPIPTLEKLMTEGRSYGVSVILGLHQLSQLRGAFGDEDAFTLVGQTSFKALLRNEDIETIEWMSKVCGEQLIEIEKVTKSATVSCDKTYTNTDGSAKTITVGANASSSESDTSGGGSGTTETSGSNTDSKGNRSTQISSQLSANKHNSRTIQDTLGASLQISTAENVANSEAERRGASSGVTRGIELRKDFVMYPSDFANFPEPATSGRIKFVAKAPSFNPWLADIPFDGLRPEYEFPDALHSVDEIKRWSDKWDACKSTVWCDSDHERLGLTNPAKSYVKPRVRLQAQHSYVDGIGEVIEGHCLRLPGQNDTALPQSLTAFAFEDDIN